MHLGHLHHHYKQYNEFSLAALLPVSIYNQSENLRHHVHVFEVFPDHPPGLGHVAGIPLDVHGLVLSFPGRGRTRFGLV